ncbi:MAG: hypothetical protein IJJ26_03085 [Victivallales bacterium]|nr:hypothetical protein [Victivallales bacterium]
MKETVRNILKWGYPACAVAAVVVSPGVFLFLNNRDQFTLSPVGMLVLSVLVFAGITALWGIPLILLRNWRHARKWTVFTLASSIALLLQCQFSSSFFNGSAPVEVDFYVVLIYLLQFALVAAPFVLAYFVRHWLFQNAIRVTSIIVLCQLAMIGATLFRPNSSVSEYDFHDYSFSEVGKFTFASEKNLIVLVVDCMGEQLFKEMARNYPEILETFRDFTCFDHITSPLPRTMYAVPAMLTGINFPRTADGQPDETASHGAYLREACRAETSLFRLCREAGWHREGYPFIMQTISYAPEVINNSTANGFAEQQYSAWKILQMTFPKFIPDFFLHMTGYNKDVFETLTQVADSGNNLLYDQVFYSRLSKEFHVGTHAYGLKYLHLHGGHDPVRTDENLERKHGVMVYRQLRGSLRILELLLQKLKDAGLYDAATIVVAGDHTERYTPESIAFVKRPGETHSAMVVNSLECQVSDLAATAAKACGLPTTGTSLFEKEACQGDWNATRQTQNNTISLPPWQRMTEPSTIVPISFHNRSCDIQDNRLFIECKDDNIHIKTFTIQVVDLTGANGFQAEIAVPEGKDSFFTSPLDFPDGVYRIMMKTQFAYVYDGTEGTSQKILHNYLVCQNGKASSQPNVPEQWTTPIQLGETLNLRKVWLFPQVCTPDDSTFGNIGLTLMKEPSFVLHLPQLPKPTSLKISLLFLSADKGRLHVSTQLTTAQEVQVDDHMKGSFVLELPATKAPMDLQLNFYKKYPLFFGNKQSFPLTLKIQSISLR